MEGKRSNPAESDEYAVEQTSYKPSEEQTTETLDRQNKDRNKQICNPCLLGRFLRVMAFYMCYVCEKSFCKGCFSRHDKSHGFLSLQSESEQLEREIDEYLSYIKNESDVERKKKFMKNNVCVCDNVDTEHRLDKHCVISGLTGYGNKWWVACDIHNYCIKVFSLRSNVLQRYISLRSQPRDVTEIIVEIISGTDNKPDRKHLLAVTFPLECFILILDLGKTPAVIHSKIESEKRCFSIDFYDGKIYTVCKKPSRDSHCSVSILSVEGVALKTFQTDFRGYWSPYLTVLNGNIYMTDHFDHRVVCYNDEGRVLHEIRIDGSEPAGICVDRSEDKVYVSSFGHINVYELKSDLSRYKPVLDQPTRYMEKPAALCFYSDKLYVGHFSWSESPSYVTVVRLL